MKGKNKKQKVITEQDLRQVLIKKALGYDATEVVEEYVGNDEGEVKLSKKKVTIKNVPPDITALKLLLDENEQQVSQMSDDELESEKIRLLKVLKEIQQIGPMIRKLSALVFASTFVLVAMNGYSASHIINDIKTRPVVQIETKTLQDEAPSYLPAGKNGNLYGMMNLMVRKSIRQNGCAVNRFGEKISPRLHIILKALK